MLYHCRRGETSHWDVFRDLPVDEDHAFRDWCFEMSTKAMKIAAMFFIFFFILGCVMINKATILLAASHMSSNRTLDCRVTFTGVSTFNAGISTFNIGDSTNMGSENLLAYRYSDNHLFYEDPGGSGDENSTSGTIWNNFTSTTPTPPDVHLHSCIVIHPKVDPEYDNQCLRHSDKDLVRTTFCDSEIIRWTWSMLLIICTPYLFVFLRSFWLVCFKSKKSPDADVFVAVSVNIHITSTLLQQNIKVIHSCIQTLVGSQNC